MARYRVLLSCMAAALFSSLASAQNGPGSDKLFSPSVAYRFYEISSDITEPDLNKGSISNQKAEQALIFMIAATALDNNTDYILPDMIKLASRTSGTLSLGLTSAKNDVNDANSVSLTEQDNSKLIFALLRQYVDKNSDLEIVREGIRYLIDKTDNREQREETLRTLLQSLGNKNDILDSELSTMLGLLMVERADFNSAKIQFINAYSKNVYNRTAFDKISELSNGQIEPSFYLRQLRLQMGENPLDIEAALAFSNYAIRLELFQTASEGFEYCADLFEYLYPSHPLPSYIYSPWAFTSYNTRRNPHQAIQIADKVRTSGVNDMFLETVAAKAAEKTGDFDKSIQILKDAEKRVKQIYLSSQSNQQQTLTEQLAWFYCFGLVDAENAITWANKAFSMDPNSPGAAALLAYALVLNDQIDWARPMLEAIEDTQVLKLTKAKIQLADDQIDIAIETLKSTIAEAPETLEAQLAKKLLKENGSEYIPPIDPDLIQKTLDSFFEEDTVPVFLRPDEIISAQLKMHGNKFSYGADFDASLVITNYSKQPLVLSEYGLLKGNIRIDAVVRGDLNKQIPNLLTMKIQPSAPIDYKNSLIVPLDIVTGELRNILLAYPQASLEIEFTVYFDPVILEDGKVINRLADIKPVTAVIERSRVKLTAQYLRNRMNALTRKKQSQGTAELFAGLLIEQNVMAQSEPLYRFMYADWMPQMLKSSLVYCLSSNEWIPRVNTMVVVRDLPLDFDMTEAVSQNLNDEYWPSRLMTVYLLNKNQGNSFKKVLDWTAKYDTNKLVRDMAIALGGEKPQN